MESDSKIPDFVVKLFFEKILIRGMSGKVDQNKAVVKLENVTSEPN